MKQAKFKLAIFDMDNTLLDGRTIIALARAFEFEKQFLELKGKFSEKYKETQAVARLLKGLRAEEVKKVAETVPLMPKAVETLQKLKEVGYKLALVSISYTLVAERLQRILGLDHIIANELEVLDGVLTGNISMKRCSYELPYCKKYSVCKRDALLNIAKAEGIPIKDCAAIGDDSSNICMFKEAGLSIAFNAPPEVQKETNIAIKEKNLERILPHLIGF